MKRTRTARLAALFTDLRDEALEQLEADLALYALAAEHAEAAFHCDDAAKSDAYSTVACALARMLLAHVEPEDGVALESPRMHEETMRAVRVAGLVRRVMLEVDRLNKRCGAPPAVRA